MNKIMSIFLILSTSLFGAKILHVSFHRGCLNEIEYIARMLGHEITSLMVQDFQPKAFDGCSQGNELYNMSHNRAENTWKLHQDYFKQFDAIITSDTAPLSRIFLQNGWDKPLIIWVCNRFDYRHGNAQDFPDQEYYNLFAQATRLPHVRVISYCPFETFFMRSKGIQIHNKVIKPCASPHVTTSSIIPSHVKKEETFFLPPYHNETACNVSKLCQNLGIKTYHGRYNGPSDLQHFKGIIHLPYAWSNFAFFENMQLGIPYFVPTIKFLRTLHRTQPNYFFQDQRYMFTEHHHELAEFYCPEYKDIIVYFDSWDDLRKKIKTTHYDTLRKKIRKKAAEHQKTMLSHWKNTFDELKII